MNISHLGATGSHAAKSRPLPPHDHRLQRHIQAVELDGLRHGLASMGTLTTPAYDLAWQGQRASGLHQLRPSPGCLVSHASNRSCVRSSLML